MNRLMKLRRSSEAGFTVFECLIAFVVMIGFMVAAYNGLTVSMKSEKVFSAKTDALVTQMFLSNYIASQLERGAQIEWIEMVSPECSGETLLPDGFLMPMTENCVMVSGHRSSYVITVIDTRGYVFTLDSRRVGHTPRTHDTYPSFVPPEGQTSEEFWAEQEEETYVSSNTSSNPGNGNAYGQQKPKKVGG